MIAMIACMSKNRVIGNKGEIPWRLPADQQFFKKTTLHHTIIMGRKTYESIGRALPSRKNVIMTRDKQFTAPHCQVVHSQEEVLAIDAEKLFIIGGDELYHMFLPYAQIIYLTVIDQWFAGDAFFPELDPSWQIIDKVAGVRDEKNPYAYSFITYQKQG